VPGSKTKLHTKYKKEETKWSHKKYNTTFTQFYISEKKRKEGK
jgi:hypothetical protein